MIKLDKEINQTASADYLRYQFDLGLHCLRRYFGWMDDLRCKSAFQ